VKTFFILLYCRLRNVFKRIFTLKAGFILLSISTTIWFLIRVIPKPQRATYPCMQVAAPILSSFVIYLLSLFGSVASFRYTQINYRRARFLMATLFLFISAFLSVTFFVQNNVPSFASENITTPNMPVGTALGIFPGRVVWSFDPAVAKFDGKTGYWWDEKNTIQTEVVRMFKSSLITLTGQTEEAAAWDALFKNFNERKNNTLLGYTTNQKIAIKINQNNTSSQENTTQINATPQLIFALLQSLIIQAKVPQNRITVFDASRFITDNIYSKCHSAFPEVIFVDNIGGNGRTKSTYVDNAIPYSVNNGTLAKGIATCAIEADYLINMALLKGHAGQGITLCGKNYYGATSINSDHTKNVHTNFNPDVEGKDRYMTFVDFIGHKDLGGKTLLFMIDGFYGSKNVWGIPSTRWKMKPFNNGWPSSLFLSQDPVAIDAVGLDFLKSEWPDLADIVYAEKYLVEAAQANSPPSNAVYDPERDNIKCQSLGVMESWNNADEKQYSRNLGKNFGIELKYADLTTSTENITTLDEPVIEIFPNPTHNTVFIKNCSSEAKIKIYDLNGKLIIDTKLSGNQINISKLIPGKYIIKFNDKDNVTSKILIKQ